MSDSVDSNLPGFSVHWIFQARLLEWAAIPSPEDLPNPGIEPGSPELQTGALLPEPPGKPGAKCQDLNSTALIIS